MSKPLKLDITSDSVPGIASVDEGREMGAERCSEPTEIGAQSAPPPRVLVCGGRSFDDRALMTSVLTDILFERGISHIITGAQRQWDIINKRLVGADYLAEEWAREHSIWYSGLSANWDRRGRSAGPYRNGVMLAKGRPTLVVAFPGGRGTANMMAQARQAGIEVIDVGAGYGTASTTDLSQASGTHTS